MYLSLFIQSGKILQRANHFSNSRQKQRNNFITNRWLGASGLTRCSCVLVDFVWNMSKFLRMKLMRQYNADTFQFRSHKRENLIDWERGILFTMMQWYWNFCWLGFEGEWLKWIHVRSEEFDTSTFILTKACCFITIAFGLWSSAHFSPEAFHSACHKLIPLD